VLKGNSDGGHGLAGSGMTGVLVKSVLGFCCLLVFLISSTIAYGKPPASANSTPPFFNVIDYGARNSGSPVIWLNECPGTILRSSRAYPGTGVFLSVKKGELRTVTLESNTLSNAATQTEESDSAGNAH
jgi:hypothetical protein